MKKLAKKVSNNEHEGHRLRVKERFFKEGGFENFEEHNIIEFLLFYPYPRGDTNERAHHILNHFGSLSALLDAPYSELIKCKEITPNTACLIKTFLPMARAYHRNKYKERETLLDFDKICEYVMGCYTGYEQEVFSVLTLDNRSRLISLDTISKGGLNSVNADVRSTIEVLIRTKASRAILVHNHPNNFALPSIDDIQTTRNIIEASSKIGVHILDHLIIADGTCVSMRSSKDYANMFE